MAAEFDWTTVEKLAIERLGVTKGAFNYWRIRNNVPHRHRLDLIALSAGAVTPDDFKRLDAAAGDNQAAE